MPTTSATIQTANKTKTLPAKLRKMIAAWNDSMHERLNGQNQRKERAHGK